MGEAKRRRAAGLAPKSGPKPPAEVKAGERFALLPVQRVEQVAPDGTKFVVLAFSVVSTDGSPLVDETTGGPVPVMVLSQPVVIGRSLMVPGSRPVAVQ